MQLPSGYKTCPSLSLSSSSGGQKTSIRTGPLAFGFSGQEVPYPKTRIKTLLDLLDGAEYTRTYLAYRTDTKIRNMYPKIPIARLRIQLPNSYSQNKLTNFYNSVGSIFTNEAEGYSVGPDQRHVQTIMCCNQQLELSDARS